MSEDSIIVLFQNVRQVILAEGWCVDNKLNVRVIPVPKPYSSECGMCLEVTKEDGERIERFAESKGMVVRMITSDNPGSTTDYTE